MNCTNVVVLVLTTCVFVSYVGAQRGRPPWRQTGRGGRRRHFGQPNRNRVFPRQDTGVVVNSRHENSILRKTDSTTVTSPVIMATGPGRTLGQVPDTPGVFLDQQTFRTVIIKDPRFNDKSVVLDEGRLNAMIKQNEVLRQEAGPGNNRVVVINPRLENSALRKTESATVPSPNTATDPRKAKKAADRWMKRRERILDRMRARQAKLDDRKRKEAKVRADKQLLKDERRMKLADESAKIIKANTVVIKDGASVPSESQTKLLEVIDNNSPTFLKPITSGGVLSSSPIVSDTPKEPTESGNGAPLGTSDRSADVLSEPIEAGPGVPIGPIDVVAGVPLGPADFGIGNLVGPAHSQTDILNWTENPGSPIRPADPSIIDGPLGRRADGNRQNTETKNAALPVDGVSSVGVNAIDGGNWNDGSVPAHEVNIGSDNAAGLVDPTTVSDSVNLSGGQQGDSSTSMNAAEPLASERNDIPLVQDTSGTEGNADKQRNGSADQGHGQNDVRLGSADIGTRKINDVSNSLTGEPTNQVELGTGMESRGDVLSDIVNDNINGSTDNNSGQQVDHVGFETDVAGIPVGIHPGDGGSPVGAAVIGSQGEADWFDPSFGSSQAAVLQSVDLSEFFSTGEVKPLDRNQVLVTQPETVKDNGLLTINGEMMPLAGQSRTAPASGTSTKPSDIQSSLFGFVFDISRALRPGNG